MIRPTEAARKLELDWTNRLKVGDVVRSRTGTLRVVRQVTHSRVESHVRTSVVFAIKACSWTRRCYTVYTSSDLRTMGYTPTRAHVKLRKKIDKAIAADIGVLHPKLTCCDVEGVN